MIDRILGIAGLTNGLIAWTVRLVDGTIRTMTTTEIALRTRGA